MSSPFYRCEPPFYADPGQPDQPLKGRKLYLVCGRLVQQPGVYTSWPSADAQYKNVSGATVKSYRDYNELRGAWHARCNKGEHDHPVDPPGTLVALVALFALVALVTLLIALDALVITLITARTFIFHP
ncbi:hypothetical protein K438DRAFT_1992271 [Mycena galopus ATCC 62051]|nr:hypothetical protein K438DRAFT_1992271 [Mycena galopus ATCC 62051]